MIKASGKSGAVRGLLAVSLLCASAAAQATVVIDQESLSLSTPASPAPVVARAGTYVVQPGVEAPVIFVQTFTNGKRGILEAIDLQISQGSGTGFLNIGLYDGDLSANPFGSSQVAFAGVFSGILPTLGEALTQSRLFTFNLSGSGYRVNPGSVSSLVFQYQPFQQNGWASLVVGTGTPFVPNQTPTFRYNQYAGGTLSGYQFRSTGVVGPLTGPADVGFRTYVNVAGVPEPSTWALLILGFGLIGGAMRRRGSAAGAAPVAA